MKNKTSFKRKDIEDIFIAYPKKIQEKLYNIRELIFDVGNNSKAIGNITETLKWGEPSYVCETGSTLRINKIKGSDEMYGIFFNCKTTLISTFKEIFGDEFVYSGNRAVLFNISDEINIENIKHCIYLSLTYKNIYGKKKVTFSLKDQLFNKEKVEYISGLIKKVYPDFLSVEFEKEVVGKFQKLELKQRIRHISNMFQKYIGDKNNFEQTVNILLESLPEVQENGTFDNNFGDFIFCPYGLFVAENGCSIKNLDFSLNALEKITSRFSCEDAIRFFLNSFEEETFAKMLEWSSSDNYHHRRLASEGTRAKLPWCVNINLDYRQTIQILDNLYCDESRYVTRSVANHLNDISKMDGDLVIDTLERWESQPQNLLCKEGGKNDLDYIISHSTRTLVKKGDIRTLEFLGYSSNPQIRVNNFEIKNMTVKIGESLNFSFDISFLPFPKGVPEGGGIRTIDYIPNLIIDYKIYFLAKNGKLLPKVFKIKKINNNNCNHSLQITKKHKLKMMTTKVLYMGKHFVEIVINGKSFGKKNFELKK